MSLIEKKKASDHLPLYGPGPVYVGSIALLTAAAVFLRKLSLFAAGRLESFRTILLILGIAFILSGIALWIYAVPISKIDDGILRGDHTCSMDMFTSITRNMEEAEYEGSGLRSGRHRRATRTRSDEKRK